MFGIQVTNFFIIHQILACLRLVKMQYGAICSKTGIYRRIFPRWYTPVSKLETFQCKERHYLREYDSVGKQQDINMLKSQHPTSAFSQHPASAFGENIWRIINTITFKNYAWILVLGHHLFLEAPTFPLASLSGKSSLHGTNDVRRKITVHTLKPK